MKAGNFSAIYEAEDAFFEDNPLKQKRRKTAGDDSPRDPRMLAIERDFKDYDYTASISEEERSTRQQALLLESRKLEEERVDQSVSAEDERALGEDALIGEDENDEE